MKKLLTLCIFLITIILSVIEKINQIKLGDTKMINNMTITINTNLSDWSIEEQQYVLEKLGVKYNDYDFMLEGIEDNRTFIDDDDAEKLAKNNIKDDDIIDFVFDTVQYAPVPETSIAIELNIEDFIGENDPELDIEKTKDAIEDDIKYKINRHFDKYNFNYIKIIWGSDPEAIYEIGNDILPDHAYAEIKDCIYEAYDNSDNYINI